MNVLCDVIRMVIVVVLYICNGYVGCCVHVGRDEFQFCLYRVLVVFTSGLRSDCLVVEKMVESNFEISGNVDLLNGLRRKA